VLKCVLNVLQNNVSVYSMNDSKIPNREKLAWAWDIQIREGGENAQRKHYQRLVVEIAVHSEY